jgi:amidohydrolase
MTTQMLKDGLDRHIDDILATRRFLHENPEVSDKEFKTAEFIRSQIEAAGLTYRTRGTSTVAFLEGSKGPGKTFLYRADIDALPMTEDDTNAGGNKKSAVSKNPGAAHTCGHDMHTAMALGVMKILAELRHELSGRVIFCFENGEETYVGDNPDTDDSRSAGAILKLLEGEQIDACFGIHVYAGLESGKFSLDPGSRMAGINKFEVTITGRSGHGSRPDQAINPISAAAYAIANLGSAWVNEIDVTKTVTLSVCSIDGGSTFNIIPDQAKFTGSMRFFDTAEGRKAEDALRRIVGGTAQMLGCTADITTGFMGASVSDAQMAARFSASVAKACGEGALGSCPPWFASETFNYYLDKWPGALAFLGIHNPDKGLTAPHHNAHFEIDEESIPVGVLGTLQIIADFLA